MLPPYGAWAIEANFAIIPLRKQLDICISVFCFGVNISLMLNTFNSIAVYWYTLS